MIVSCGECKSPIDKPDKEIKRQLKKNPNRLFFCDTSCSCSYYNRLNPRLIVTRANTNTHDQYSYLKYYMRKARNRDKNTDLTLEYLDQIWKIQNGRCALTGKEFKQYKDSLEWEKDTSNPWKPSLDRIDSSKGYIQGNVRFICIIANFAKGVWDDSVLYELAQSLIGNNHG